MFLTGTVSISCCSTFFLAFDKGILFSSLIERIASNIKVKSMMAGDVLIGDISTTMRELIK